MMLSEILNRFFVLPLNQSELVCFSTEDHPKHGEIIVVTWKDSDTLDSFCQKFVDQEVDLSDATRFKGQFSVTPIGDGSPVAFVALDTVSLERPKRRPYNASGSLSEYGVFPECDAQQPADVRKLVAKLAAHVRPTCSELWHEAQAFLATRDECHCGTCTCDPNMTPAVRFDLSPAQKEGAIREHLIRLGWTPPREVE